MLMDLKNAECPERSTALVCCKLACFNINMAALNETRLAKEVNIKENLDPIIFWKGKEASEQHIHGVSFTVKTKLMDQCNLITITFDDHPNPTQAWNFPNSSLVLL